MTQMPENYQPFKLKKPCANCPFLKDRSKAIRLHGDRVPSILNDLASNTTSSFHCHKTTRHGEEDEEGNYVPSGDELQCAGAYAVLEKAGVTTVTMAMAEAYGLRERGKLVDIYDLVIDYKPR